MAPILTKFGGNEDIGAQQELVALSLHFIASRDAGRRHLEFRKSVATSLLVDQSSPNLMGMLRT